LIEQEIQGAQKVFAIIVRKFSEFLINFLYELAKPVEERPPKLNMMNKI
jgi:hypothetical protein